MAQTLFLRQAIGLGPTGTVKKERRKLREERKLSHDSPGSSSSNASLQKKVAQQAAEIKRLKESGGGDPKGKGKGPKGPIPE